MSDVGLGYIRLGQPATQLSGGEAQRVKLSTELSKRATGRTMYILDEPTTGLSFEDCAHLLRVLHRLVDAGNSVVLIEHHLDLIKNADWIIDLGPGAGDSGGHVIAEGTPEDLANLDSSSTGRYLRAHLGLDTARRGRRGATMKTAFHNPSFPRKWESIRGGVRRGRGSSPSPLTGEGRGEGAPRPARQRGGDCRRHTPHPNPLIRPSPPVPYGGTEIDETRLRALLDRFKNHGLSADDVIEELRVLPFRDLDFAKVDHHRAVRTGFPEVVFAQGKSPEQVASIAAEVLQGLGQAPGHPRVARCIRRRPAVRTRRRVRTARPGHSGRPPDRPPDYARRRSRVRRYRRPARRVGGRGHR